MVVPFPGDCVIFSRPLLEVVVPVEPWSLCWELLLLPKMRTTRQRSPAELGQDVHPNAMSPAAAPGRALPHPLEGARFQCLPVTPQFRFI